MLPQIFDQVTFNHSLDKASEVANLYKWNLYA